MISYQTDTQQSMNKADAHLRRMKRHIQSPLRQNSFAFFKCFEEEVLKGEYLQAERQGIEVESHGYTGRGRRPMVWVHHSRGAEGQALLWESCSQHTLEARKHIDQFRTWLKSSISISLNNQKEHESRNAKNPILITRSSF